MGVLAMRQGKSPGQKVKAVQDIKRGFSFLFLLCCFFPLEAKCWNLAALKPPTIATVVIATALHSVFYCDSRHTVL